MPRYNYGLIKSPQTPRKVNRNTAGFIFQRSTSSIDLLEGKDETKLTFVSHYSQGRVAQTGLFANASNSVKRVVKQPVIFNYGPNVIAAEIQNFKNERDKWNIYYPNNPAILVTDASRADGGIRLILPWVPGKTYTNVATDDPLLRSKHLLAIACAFLELNEKGLFFYDFNEDNVLLDENADGTFKAYLIDFGGVGKTTCGQELGFLLRHVSCQTDRHSHIDSIQNIISILHERIAILSSHNIAQSNVHRTR